MADGNRKRPYLLKRHLKDPTNAYYTPFSDQKRVRLMDEGRFPPCVWLGPYIPAWEPDDLDTFFANLPTDGGQQPPVLWPPRPKREPNLPIEMTYGRTPGGKVIIDPVTGRRRYVFPKRVWLAKPTRRDPPDDPPLSQAAE